MKSVQIIFSFVSIFVTIPIWLYLLHFVLAASHAGSLQMFLFWVYVPLQIFLTVLGRLIEISGGVK